MLFNYTAYKKYFHSVACYILTAAILLTQLQTKATAGSLDLSFTHSSTFQSVSLTAGNTKAEKQIAYFFEVLAEESEEEEAGVSAIDTTPQVKAEYFFKEHVYTACIQSQLFHQAYSVSKQCTTPLFLLYHSWKSHLA